MESENILEHFSNNIHAYNNKAFKCYHNTIDLIGYKMLCKFDITICKSFSKQDIDKMEKLIEELIECYREGEEFITSKYLFSSDEHDCYKNKIYYTQQMIYKLVERLTECVHYKNIKMYLSC